MSAAAAPDGCGRAVPRRWRRRCGARLWNRRRRSPGGRRPDRGARRWPPAKSSCVVGEFQALHVDGQFRVARAECGGGRSDRRFEGQPRRGRHRGRRGAAAQREHQGDRDRRGERAARGQPPCQPPAPPPLPACRRARSAARLGDGRRDARGERRRDRLVGEKGGGLQRSPLAREHGREARRGRDAGLDLGAPLDGQAAVGQRAKVGQVAVVGLWSQFSHGLVHSTLSYRSLDCPRRRRGAGRRVRVRRLTRRSQQT